MEEKNAKIMAMTAQKGGVGKTTSTRNIAKALVMEGYKVLLIDSDGQANLTTCFGIDEPETLNHTLFTLMMCIIGEQELPPKEEYIRSVDGVDLIPSSIALSNIELNLVSAMSREHVLNEIIEEHELRKFYDYIIIDCSPSLGLMTLNTLVCSDSVLIPVTPEFLSAKGLEMIIDSVLKAKRRLNKSLTFEGIILTMYDERTNLSKDISSRIKSSYGEHIKIFDTKISKAVKVGEANAECKSIIEFAPEHKVSKEYLKLAKELIK